jgi:gas vesicle protein
MKQDDTAARLAALLAGLGVGAIVAFLATPRSGEEIREGIAEKTNQGKDYAKQKAGQLARQVEDSVRDVKDAVQVGKGVYREQISQARAGRTNRQTGGTD